MGVSMQRFGGLRRCRYRLDGIAVFLFLIAAVFSGTVQGITLSKSQEKFTKGALAAFFDEIPEIRALGLERLRELGDLQRIGEDEMPRIGELLDHNQPGVRIVALRALAEMGEKAKGYIPRIAALMSSGENSVRTAAINAIGNFETLAPAHLPAIEKLALEGTDDGIKDAATNALGKLCAYSPDGRSVIRRLLESPKPNSRLTALTILKNNSELSAFFSKHIEHLQDSEEMAIRVTALTILAKTGKKTTLYLSQIENVLLNEALDLQTRVEAIKILGNLGERAIDLMPKLIPLIKNSSALLRYVTMNAIGKVYGGDSEIVIQRAPRVAEEIAGLLKSNSSTTRFYALEALRRMGRHSEKYIPQIIPLFRDEDKNVRVQARETVRHLGKYIGESASEIGKMLNSDDKGLQATAVSILGQSGKFGYPYIPKIAALMDDLDLDVRFNAVEALGNLGQPASEHFCRVALFLNEPRSELRKPL